MNKQILRGHESTLNGNPSVYIGTYAKYNEGSIEGAWLDLTTFYDLDEFYEFCRELHNDENEPEFMFQDFENFPEKFWEEFCLSEELWEWLELDEENRSICEEYWDEIDDSASIPYILDRIAWIGSLRDFLLQQLEDEFGPKHPWWMDYFDIDKFENDLSDDYHITTKYIFYAY